jgi:hypothetical protein
MTTQKHEQTPAAWDKIAPGYDEFVTATHTWSWGTKASAGPTSARACAS